MDLRRAILLLTAGVITGITTELGRQIVISDQFHQMVWPILPWNHARGVRSRRPPASDVLKHETTGHAPQQAPPQAQQSGDTVHGDGDRQAPDALKCPSPVETPWQRDAKGDSIIWKCMGHGYFVFQCTVDELALVTQGVSRLTAVRFLGSGRRGGRDATLIAVKATPYYYYPLTRHSFARIKRVPAVSLVDDSDRILHLDLTNLRPLSDLAFLGCPAA